MYMRPPCIPGKIDASIAPAYSLRAKIIPPLGPRRVLCVVIVTTSAYGNGGTIGTVGNKTRFMGNICHIKRADFASDLSHPLVIDFPRIRGSSKLIILAGTFLPVLLFDRNRTLLSLDQHDKTQHSKFLKPA